MYNLLIEFEPIKQVSRIIICFVKNKNLEMFLYIGLLDLFIIEIIDPLKFNNNLY